jgi:uncharacterized protein (TIGR00369 family)
VLKSIAELRATGNLAGINALVPYARTVGLELQRDDHGLLTVLRFREHNIGNFVVRTIHGGVVTSLLDTLCGLVVMASVPEGTPLATLDLRIEYLRPATPEQTIRATAECYKVTASVAFVRGQAFHDSPDDAIAHCTGTFMLGGVGFSAAAAVPDDSATVNRREGGDRC